MIRNARWCLALVILLTTAGLASAEEPAATTNFIGKTPTVEQLVSALKSQPESKMKYRSIHVKPIQPKVMLDVRFELDSDKLTEETKTTLKALGQALTDAELKQSEFQVKGHTDSRGTPKYNQNLSKLRALAVTNFLVKNYGVNSKRLQPIGKGEAELFNTTDPESGENRRVEIVNVGSVKP